MAEETHYTLHLILLECLEGQEFDGDEPYLKMNGEDIWTWRKMGRKMHDMLTSNAWTNAFDFRTGRYRTLEGWQPSENYDSGDFVFAALEGETRVELWEADEHEALRGDDDFLGELVVTAENIRMGEQMIIFDQNNALYQLTYRLTADKH